MIVTHDNFGRPIQIWETGPFLQRESEPDMAKKLKPAAASSSQTISDALIESAFATVAESKLDGPKASKKHREVYGKLRSWRMKLAAHRAFDKYAKAGGNVGDVTSFLDWLIANWDSILKMIMSIISLFSAA